MAALPWTSEANHHLQEELCRALGLDPAHVRQLHIHVDPDQIVTVEVEREISAQEGAAVCAALAAGSPWMEVEKPPFLGDAPLIVPAPAPTTVDQGDELPW